MRLLLAIPMLALVILAYNALALSGSQIQPESLLFSMALPSGGEVFFEANHVFLLAGLAALFIEVIKAARLASGTIADHMLSTLVFVAALLEFLLVGFCGTAAFFLLMIMALIDVVAGFSVSIFSARRDYSVSHGRDGGL